MRLKNFLLVVFLPAVVLIGMFFAVEAKAATYYVAKNGNDANSGLVGVPWLTIQKAANTVVAGDIVRVQPGTYEERVSESTDGAAGNLITYVADGSVVLRGFIITGDYVRIIGFEITHAVPTHYSGIYITNAQHVEILDCNIHNIGCRDSDGGTIPQALHGIAIDPEGASFLVLRGNTISYPGSPADNTGLGTKAIDDWGAVSNNVLIEYNNISHVTDFICSNGDYYIARNNILGPSSVSDFGGAPHVDGWQANSQTRYGFMEANWHVNNSVSDSHMILIESPVSGTNAHFAVVKNVSLRSGDHLWYQMRDGDNLHAAHNSVGQIGYGPRGGPGSSGFFYVWSEDTPSNNNFSFNNIFYNVTTAQVYTVNSGSDLTHSNDHADVGNDIVGGVSGNIKSDPTVLSWTNYSSDNLTLKTGAPDIDAGARLATVTSQSGIGASFTVSNPDWFYDGFTLTEGQKIYVGDDNNLTITAVNYTTNTITVNNSFTWVNGDPVGYAYRGSGPDLGAYEYGDALLTGATISANGNDHGVVPSGDARFVIFYRDGIPYSIDYSAPYAATISGGAVTAKAYALHAQSNPIVMAISSSDVVAPSVPENLSAAAISSSQINLSWTASTDAVGVAGYRIYRGGVQIATSTGTSYSDTGLAASAQYSYTVSAFDAARNFSAQSAAAVATTSAPIFYIRTGAGGSGNGTDWTNAYSSMPAALQRGATYYIADGTYGDYTFDDAASGEQYITIKKAVAADYGTSAGWNSSYGDGQAAFTRMRFFRPYYQVDGQVGENDSGYGIYVNNNVNLDNKCLDIRYYDSYFGHHIIIEHVEARHMGMDLAGGDDADIVYLLGIGTDYVTDITFNYCYFHDVTRDLVFMRNIRNVTFDHCWFANCQNNQGIHGQGFSIDTADSSVSLVDINLTVRYSFLKNIEGAGFINIGLDHVHAHSGVNIYGNVFYSDSDLFTSTDGVITSMSANAVNGAKIYNNTFAFLRSTGVSLIDIVGFSAGSGNEAYNNIIYGLGGKTANWRNVSHDYNWYYNAGTQSESHVQNGSGDPFVNSGTEDFSLAASVNGALTLASPFDYDLTGSKRGDDGIWDIGAYECAEEATSTDLTPPTGSVSINSGDGYTNNILATLSLTASDISGVTQMAISNTNIFDALTAVAFSSPLSWTLSAVDGIRTVYVWFKDSLNNWNITPFTDTITLDRAAASITGIFASNISANSATITWTTSESAVTYLDYGLTSAYGQATTEETSYATAHAITLSGLSASTTYNFRVNASDRAGNQSFSVNQTFTTAASSSPDIISPAKIIDLSSNSILSTSGYLYWTATGDDSNVGLAEAYDLRYSIAVIADGSTQVDSWWNSATPIAQTMTPKISGQAEGFQVLGLTAQTTYYFALKAIDEAGNPSPISNIINFTTPAAAVVAPPSGGGGGSSGGGGGGGGSSGGTIINTSGAEAPTNFIAIGAKDQIYLQWANPINSTFAGVKLYRKTGSAIAGQTDAQGTLIYEGIREQFTDLNLLAGSQYFYTIYAYDRDLKYSLPKTVSAALDQSKETIDLPKTEVPAKAEDQPSASAQGGRTTLVGVKSADVEIITKAESQTLRDEAQNVPLSAATLAIYKKIIALAEKPQTQENKYAIAGFIHYGTPTTIVNGAGERGGAIASFRSAFGRLPETEIDWQDVIKIANGRWPTQRNVSAEYRAQGGTFVRVYGRTADMKNANDNAAVTVMVYGLRPAQRNMNSEKAGINAFKYIYKKTPATAEEWDIVRAIAYSGAKR